MTQQTTPPNFMDAMRRAGFDTWGAQAMLKVWQIAGMKNVRVGGRALPVPKEPIHGNP